jgi:xanthine dehydrogenase small subunit
MGARLDKHTNGIDGIRFVLDGEVHEISNVDPTRTVLQYLREDLGRKGSKEGCAEGDCGACTVVVAELDGEDIDVRAINSCIQLLPTLDGKELITVESLNANADELHPVQQAMVDCHGSQCGFCTPGFVMSLFALYKTRERPTRREIDDVLAGNLCRCTGYRPIIDAATAMYDAPASTSDWLRQPCGSDQETGMHIKQLESIRRSDSLALTGSGDAFFAPRGIDELASLLAEYPDATILAGGTDVGLWVTKQYRELGSLIYLGEVEGLDDIVVTDGVIDIGAAVSLTDAMPVLVEYFPDLHEMLRRFASPPIRNAGTLAGNVANGSPIGDTMPALMAAGTSLQLRSAGGVREIALDDFYHDYMVNDLQAGEFIERIRVPLPGDNVTLRSYKLSKRFDQDISAVCTAYRLELDEGMVRSARIACGGLAATIRRAPKCEAAIRGQPWNEDTVAAGKAAFAEDYEPISDMRASAPYRLRAAQNLLQRLYLETSGQLDQTVYEYGRQG